MPEDKIYITNSPYFSNYLNSIQTFIFSNYNYSPAVFTPLIQKQFTKKSHE